MNKILDIYQSNNFDGEYFTEKEEKLNLSFFGEFSDINEELDSTSFISQNNKSILFENDFVTQIMDSQIKDIINKNKNQNNAIFNRRNKIYNQFFNILQSYNYTIQDLKTYQIVNMFSYGSIVSGDSLFDSDQDFLVIIISLKQDTIEEYESFLNELIKNIKNNYGVQEVSKLKGSNSNKLFSLKYKFYENPQIFNIDFNFCKINNLILYQQVFFNPVFRFIQLKKYYYSRSQQMLENFILLKMYLKNNEINESFKGGLSSTGLFCLLLAYYKKCDQNNSSIIQSSFQFLLNFLNFIIHFDFENDYIDLNSEEVILKKKEQYIIDKNPYILNPLVNYNYNIFNIKHPLNIKNIKKHFEKIYIELINIMEKYDKNEENNIKHYFQNIFQKKQKIQ
jgi:predicted nucleotidyltransferase